MANNFFTISSFFYSLLLSIIYFRRKNIGNLEARVYSCLVVTNFFNVVLALIDYFTITNINTIPFLNEIVSKTLLLIFIVWALFFSIYIYIITRKEKSDKKIKKYKWFLLMVYILITFFIYFLPLYYYNENKIVYSYGPSANFAYALVAMLMVCWIIVVLKNYNILKTKKGIPIVLFVVLAIIAVVIQKQYPGLLLITAVETFITVIMFFTIENPDVKVIEEIHKAKEISDNANEEKAMFLYNMTNEIRNITRDIDYSANAILDETDNKKVNVEIISNSAREIKGSTAKFTTMTNEILDISQIDSANIKIYNDKYNVKLIIKELIQIYKAKSENKGLDFRTSIASDIPDYLYGDSVGLKTSLNVILDNSVKYTSSGYVEFNVSSIIKNDICRLIITVEDSGIGMKAEEIGKIFNRKEKEKDNLNLSNNLYNAKKLITLMNGTIIPSSVYGKGTVMKIVLDQKAAEVDNNLAKYESIYDKKRILLVDDNESSIKIINKLLADTNIELDSVTLGSECLEKIRNKEKYDLILLDEKMKPLDGITVMKKLKDIRTFNTKVILLSRDNNHEYDEEYLKYGFSDYILKPIDKEKFREKIDKCLK